MAFASFLRYVKKATNTSLQHAGDAAKIAGMPLDAQDKIALEGLENRFTYHGPTGDQPERYKKLRESALHFARMIVEQCPSSPERSTSLTHLDAAVMFANASIARNQAAAAE
jgi:hypothetical protein